MSAKWPTVPLGEVLTEREETPLPKDLVSGRIKIISKISFQSGQIQIRPDGETKTGMILVRPGDLVVSGINAAKGAIAIYGHENKEPVAATIHYGAYVPDSSRASTKFLWWMLRSRFFRDLLSAYLPGGIKTELKAKRLLLIPIPLPPLEEQLRVVTRIEELAAQIQDARNWRQQALEEVEGLIDSTMNHILSQAASEASWEYGAIPAFAEVNPSRTGQIHLSPGDPVSFVPMKAVDEATGTIAWPETRPFSEVAEGHTWFAEGDVIFARITPCMQNGKAAIARNLVNNTAFGSTEFHVIRPGPKLIAEWLHVIVRHKTFRDDAAAHFKGTAGQQRVPRSFLEQKVIPVPPLPEQRQIVAELDKLQAKVGVLNKLQAETAAELDALSPSILDKAFKGEL